MRSRQQSAASLHTTTTTTTAPASQPASLSRAEGLSDVPATSGLTLQPPPPLPPPPSCHAQKPAPCVCACLCYAPGVLCALQAVCMQRFQTPTCPIPCMHLTQTNCFKNSTTLQKSIQAQQHHCMLLTMLPWATMPTEGAPTDRASQAG